MSIAWLLVAMLLPLAATGSTADPSIEGRWKHRDKPAWIDFSFESGIGTAIISRHDDNPDAEGNAILIEIHPKDSSKTFWRAKMYSAAADDFVGVTLELSEDASSLVVTFEEEEILHLHRPPSSQD